MHPKDNKVYIKYYSDYLSYQEVAVDSAHLDKQGHFKMTFSWEKPYPATFYSGDEMTEMFLTPGDSLFLTMDAKKFDETVAYSGKGALINNHLAKEMLIDHYPKGNTYLLPEQQYIAWVDSVYEVSSNRLKQYFKTENQSSAIQNYLNYAEAELMYTNAGLKFDYPGLNAYLKNQKANTEVSPGYYDFLSNIEINNPGALESPAYLDFIQSYVDRKAILLFKKDTTKALQEYRDSLVISQMPGAVEEFLLAAWSYNAMTDEGDMERGKEFMARLKNQAPESKYLGILNDAYTELLKLSPGNRAPNFTFKDVKGNDVSLTDFKGKVVYLDFWATWCGPCRREIPAAKALETSLKGKDVVFLAVSLDESEKEWKDLVKKQELPGIHLLSPGNFESIAAQLYKVQGIPRYYLIDRNGMIVDNDAPRPTDGAKDAIEKELLK
jgi:peroxiredoxin